ncbi:hypothetical protein BH20GEM2_BH20GEM2_22010 [soil metagenome]
MQDPLGQVQGTCIAQEPGGSHCYLSIIEDRIWFFHLGLPQIGSQAYVTMSPLHHLEIETTPWAPCGFNAAHQGRRGKTLQKQLDTEVYTMHLKNGNVEPVHSFADEIVFWVGQAENNEELVLGRGLWTITFWADAAVYYQTGSPFHDLQQKLDRCVIEYREREGILLDGSFPTDYACSFGFFNYPSRGAGGGTISRAPLARLLPAGRPDASRPSDGQGPV